MTFDVPKGWDLRTLSELAGADGVVADGDWIESKDQDPNGDVRLIQLADIGDGRFLNRSSRFLTSKKARDLGCTLLKKGDLLIARMPDPLGRACLFPGAGQPSITAVDIFIWRPGTAGAEPRWLMHAINSPQVREHLQEIAGGTTRQRVSGGNLKRLALPTPPKAIQQRIVARLETLLACSKSARDELGHVPKLVSRYKKAVLSAAYSAAESVASEITTLGSVAEEVRNGVSRKPENAPPGIPVLKISAVRSMNVRMDERRYYVPEAGEDVSRYELRAGDLLFTRYNGNPDLVANCGMVRILDEQLIYPDKLIRIRVNRELADPEFVEAVCAPRLKRALPWRL